MAAPIPSTAFLQVTDLQGSGGGPFNMTTAKTIKAVVEGTRIDLGPYLLENLKKQAVGSNQIAFELTAEFTASINTAAPPTGWEWNSVDCSEQFWFMSAKSAGTASPLSFVYRPAVGVKSTTNPELTVHLPQMPDGLDAVGTPDTATETTITLLGDYYLLDFDTLGTHSWGTSLA